MPMPSLAAGTPAFRYAWTEVFTELGVLGVSPPSAAECHDFQPPHGPAMP